MIFASKEQNDTYFTGGFCFGMVVKVLIFWYIRGMDDRQELTKDTYNKIAENWAGKHNTRDFWKKEFEAFARLLPAGRVLDVGCGAGRDYQLFGENGYDYTGVDYSKNLLAVARAEWPDAKFTEADMLDLPFLDHEFDGFWAAASLLHIPKEQIGEALGELKRVVKKGGVGFISLKKGEGERVVIDEDDKGDRRFFAYWQREEFQNVLEKCGFQVLDFLEHPASEKTTWLSFFVRV